MEKTRTGPSPLILVLTALALCAAVVLALTVWKSVPYIRDNEDPELAIRATESTPSTEPTEVDPYQVPIPYPEKNPHGPNDFQYDGRYLSSLRCDSIPGIDVSAYQGDVNWNMVAASGIEFALIRVGYRGYGTGKIVEDTYARDNLRDANLAGLKVGAYFFSQALNEQEVEEEVAFLLDIIKDYEITMPVVFDWEYVNDTARTADMDPRTLTDLNLYYCELMEAAGYQPMIYFNSHQARTLLYLYELEEYPFWLAYYNNRMNYPHRFEMWQYTCTGRVPGIKGDVDINVLLLDQELRPE